mgnify:FL=1
MKNKIKAAVSLLLSLLLALGCMGTSAFAADRNLGNVTLAFSTETGSITVVQNLNAVEQLGITGGPVAGVEYTLAQIGSLCEITYTGGYMTGYAVKKSTVEKLGIEDAANYTDGTNYCIYTSEATLEVLAKEIAELTTEDLKDKFSGSPTEKTDANGEAEFETLDYGLYLILQTDVSGAEYEGEPITLSHLQTPMLVSVPQSAGQSDVTVKVKTPLGYGELTKSIVGIGDIDGNWENVEDSATEVTGPGDYIRFRLAVQPPRLSSGDTLDHFVIEDVRSKGLELEKLESVTDTLGQTYVEGTDYTRTEETVADGTRMLLTFTQQGLQKLERLGRTAGTLTVVYTTQVTEDAVTAGITNSARIDYKVDYAPDRDNPPPPDDPPPEDDDDEYHSDWDVARSYTFGVHMTKYLGEEGNLAPEGSVTFALYREKDGQKQAVPLSRSGDAYQVALQGSNELSVSADGTFTILGLGEGTYYLRELSTAEGYALPNEDIALTLAGERSAGEYTGRLDAAQCTVDGQQGNASVQDGTLYLSVINPRTFYIPNTGGAGSWMFTAGGLLIIAGGVVYLAVSRKKKR